MVLFMLSVVAFAEGSTTSVGIVNDPSNINSLGIVNNPSNTNSAQALAMINQVFPTTIINNPGGSGGSTSSEGFVYKPINFAEVRTTLGVVQSGPCSNVKIFAYANESDGNGTLIAITNGGTATADISGWRAEDDSGLVIGNRTIRGKTLAPEQVYLFRHIQVPADGTIVHIMSAETINSQEEVDSVYLEPGMAAAHFLGTWNYVPQLSQILKKMQKTGLGSSKWYLDFSSYF
jgi:hypothetical protein